MNTSYKVAVVVPVYNPGALWPIWLDAVDNQSAKLYKKVVIDSSSSDGFVELSSGYGFDVVVIPNSEFDHGGTRQLAVEFVGDADIIVYLTQDAILQNKDSIRKLIKAFDDPEVAVVYGRQLPNEGATLIEAHARIFNYTENSHVYSLKDKGNVGLKAAFNSNSFSAYRVTALKEINGFNSNVIFGEDMLVAAEALNNNYKIAYCHNACVYHSHAYTLKQEFQRYFDMGVMHQTHNWLLTDFGKPTGEGFRFIKSEVGYLLKHAFWRIPEALMRTIIKYVGYRAGLANRFLPTTLKQMFSMNKKYWLN